MSSVPSVVFFRNAANIIFHDKRRIVARVDQLMFLCDELEARLARSQANGERLMEAVVSRIVETSG